jgi:hypothetical protein
MSKLILPGTSIARPMPPPPPGLPPSAIPLDRLGEHLMATGLAEGEIHVGDKGDRVLILATCGPLRIPMAFTPEQIGPFAEGLARSIRRARAAGRAAELRGVGAGVAAPAPPGDTIPEGFRIQPAAAADSPSGAPGG